MFTKKIITEVGYIETTIPFPYFNKLLINLNNQTPQENFNGHLAGQIENEKRVDENIIPNEIKQLISQGCYEYIETFGHNQVTKEKYQNNDYSLEHVESWINYQKRGEYNPRHTHSGDLVYVMWIKIPYELRDEMNFPSCKNSSHQVASCFQFTDRINLFSPRMYDIIYIDKTYEGRLIIFHSHMAHTVYPFFTSNEYRISMSGNFNIIRRKRDDPYNR